MKKIGLIFIALAISVSSFAEVDPIIIEGIDTITTTAIHGPKVSCALDDGETFKEKFSIKGADCSKFIRSDGSFGKYGNVIVNHLINLKDKFVFFESNFDGFKRSCPNWNQLSMPKKAQFVVWLMASIALSESTCGADTVNASATHGTAVGLLQLNKNKKDRAWRGGSTGNSCAAKDISDNASNLQCGLEILNEQLKGKEGLYEGSGRLYGRDSNSYWQKLRKKDGGTIMNLVKEFPYCDE